MFHARILYLAAIWCGASPLLTGCVALSLGIGGKTQQVERVISDTETKDRVTKLEARVQTLEQLLTQPLPSTAPVDAGPALPQ